MRQKTIFFILLILVLNGCKERKRTAKICLFGYFTKIPSLYTIDSIAQRYDLIIMKDKYRSVNPHIRKISKEKYGRKLLIFVYKDGMTLIGPGNPSKSSGDSIRGGGGSVGGFWHFDSIFRGIGYDADTFFLMASNKTRHKDKDNRVHAGIRDYWKYRWVMDWGEPYWAKFYAENTKIQCLRNYETLIYDSTYFDGVYIDNILHFNNEYGILSHKYWNDFQKRQSSDNLQEAIISFLKIVSQEYHSNKTPLENPRRIMAIGNTNKAYQQKGYWQRCLKYLDGGMEQFFAQTWQKWQDFDDWIRMIEEIEYAEAQGKICIARTTIDTFIVESHRDPHSIIWYDSTQMMFGFTSYLMAADSMTYFSFQGDEQHIFWSPVLDIDLGRPKGSFVIQKDSIAYRLFEKGKVYCNPGKSAKKIVISDDKYIIVEASADTVSTNVLHLPSYQGVIIISRD